MFSQLITPSDSPRVVYLRDLLHLQHDPFINPVAEWEIQNNPEDPPFFAYYTDPPYLSSDEINLPLLDKIQQANTAIVYGSAGSGKTTLCYRLGAACREIATPTLAFTHVLGKISSQVKINDLGLMLNEALAIDLFVQVMEKFDFFNPHHAEELIPILASYWECSIPQFKRRVRKHLALQHVVSSTGMSAQWWSLWQRTAVRYTPFTTERIQFLNHILEWSATFGSGYNAEYTFEEGVSLAQQVGFQQLFLLVDVIGDQQVGKIELSNHVGAVWEYLSRLPLAIPVYPKFFLPLSFQALFDPLISQSPLISPVFSAIINWNSPHKFVQLIKNRFHSAGGWIQGFEVLASDEISHKLGEAILTIADRSPRRLLQLHSLLIDAHVSRDSTDPQITAVDWQRLCDMWVYGDPHPTPLMDNVTIMRS